MKTIYKKALITLIAAILIEIIIVYFLYTSMSAFYADLTKKTAFLLVEQVKNVLNIDMSKLSLYNRYPKRSLLKNVSSSDSEILHVLLIDTTYQIILSDDPSVEGKIYTDESEIELLKGEEPKVVHKKWEGNIEILDVIHPLVQDSVKQGYLRTIISIKHLQNFYQNRRIILVVASLFTFIILIITVFLTSRIYKTELLNIVNAIEKLNQEDYEYPYQMVRKKDLFAPVFPLIEMLFVKVFGRNESYKKSQEKINTILQVIHEGLMIVDDKMKIISYNQYLLDIFQTKNRSNPEEELYQIFMKNPILVETYRRAKDPLTHSVNRSFSIQLLTGNTIDVQINTFSLFEGASSKNIIIYVKNKGKLQELGQIVHRSMMFNIISKLSSSISHEVRNPLSSLAIHTEVLDNLSDSFPVNGNHQNKFKKSIKILKSEINRLKNIFDQFFKLTRSEEITLSYEDINSIIREVMELVHQKAYEKSVKLSYHLGKDLPRVNVNRDQIKQAILNIILNAYDAMPDGGKLDIISKEQDNKVVVEFNDTGMGIQEKNKDKIFNLYFSTKRDGTGVGLAFSKEVIDAHEGKIYFTSKANQGTTFYVELPRS